MLAPWMMLIFCVAFVLLFVAVHRVAGDGSATRVLSSLGIAVVLSVLIGAFGHLRQGYLGVLNGGLAGAAATAHLTIMVLVVLRGTYVISRARVAGPPPFLTASELRLLARRPMKWRWARLLVILSAAVMALIGMPSADRRTLLVNALWVVGSIVGGWLGLTLFTFLVRRRRLSSVRAAVPVPAGVEELNELMALWDDFDRHDLDTIDRKIDVLRRLSAAAPDNLDLQVTVIYDLSTALSARYECTKERTDLEEAIALGRRALEICPPGYPNRHLRFWTFSTDLATRGRLADDGRDLDEAVRLAEESVADAGTDLTVAGWAMSTLADVLLERYRWNRSRPDLDRAVDVARTAVERCPPGVERRITVERSLFNSLRQRHDDFGDPADADDAIATIRAALSAATREGSDLTDHLTAYALVLNSRAASRLDRADVDESIGVLTGALENDALADQDRAHLLAALGNAYKTRFELFGELADIDRAVASGREVLALSPPDEAPRARHNLVSDLGARYDHLGELSDLQEAMELEALALAETPAGADYAASALSSQGVNFRLRFELTRDVADIDEAVRLGRAAVSAAAPGDHALSQYLSVLADSLVKRFEARDDHDDIDEAVRVSREATLTPRPAPDDPTGAQALDHLATALHTRYDRYGETADLDEGVTTQRQAVASTPRGFPSWGVHQFNLGLGLERLWQRTKDPATAREAIDAWRQAVAETDGPPQARIRSAVAWARVAGALDDWADATDAFAAAVDLLPLVGWRGLEAASAENALSHWQLLASYATSAALQCGQTDRAITLLERGRGVLWSQLLETRTELDGLAVVAPRLAQDLAAAREALNRDQPGGSGQRMTAAREWQRLVAQARRLPGFADFLAPPPLPDLAEVAAEGPVVLLNASSIRCDALVLTSSGTRVVPLPSLSLESLVTRGNEYLAALAAFENSPHGAGDLVRMERVIGRTLHWLWDDVARPVLDVLEPAGRIWWCPTGFFALLPVHAAGYHDISGRSVLDHAVSSYVPSLRALADARRGATGDGAARLLLVTLPQTSGLPELPGVLVERSLLLDLFEPDALTGLEGPAATVAATVGQIPAHNWLHFSCHGIQDLRSPSRSGLRLYDGTLTTAAIGRIAAAPGEFVFLSACKTATATASVPDEAIHMTAALQYAGFRHVVGTLWSVYDDATPKIAGDVYRGMRTGDGFDVSMAARALHDAVRRARQEARGRYSRWVPFIHTGP